jgi:integrase/recombinase XerD
LSLPELCYSDLLEYIQTRRHKGDGKRYINDSLIAIRHYFEYLVSEHIRPDNPAGTLFIRGVKRSIPHHLLDQGQLHAIYKSYPVIDERTHRNKVMLGLLIYQGLTPLELARLQPSHIDLFAGQVIIASSRRSNARKLWLEPKQIDLLKQYLTLIRPLWLANLSQSGLSAREQLFFGREGDMSLSNTIMGLMQEVRSCNKCVRNAPHIRMSVIAQWLRTKDLRVVQYLSGHKYVSSTERYLASHLSALQAELARFHPLYA